MIEDITPHAKTVSMKTRVSIPAARGLLRRLYGAGMEGVDATTALIYYLNTPADKPYGSDAGRVAAIMGNSR